jgi:hypothetical protein
MRATLSLLVTSFLLSLLAFDYQAIAVDVPSTSSSQHLLSAKPNKPSKPPTYRGSGRRGEPF